MGTLRPMSRVVVVGAGRQGPAAAYDLAVFGKIDQIAIADNRLDAAQAACDKVNGLLGREQCQAVPVDASSIDGLTALLHDFDLAIAAAPYRLNPNVALAGLAAKCHVVDMGVDTPDALEIHARSEEAAVHRVCLVTDAGVAPGMVNVMAYRLLAEHPDTTDVALYCGGLPETAEAPFYHRVGFSVESLIGEYVDEVDSLRGGEVVREQALEDLESLEFPGFGVLEAVTTSGGTGSAPYHLGGRLQSYVYKTLRYPGHWSAMRLLRDGGFWSEESLPTGEVPFHVTAQLMERHMVVPNDRDVVVARVVASSPSGRFGYDMVDHCDSAFTAMQRTTGFSTAIVALEVLGGRVQPGCWACEEAVDPFAFFEQAARRGIHVTEQPYDPAT